MRVTRWQVQSAVAALVLILAASAGAAQRTFVASTGNDLNACSLAAPCRGFPRALSQTDPKGEVIVLDSAGYGAATVDRSVSIIAPPGVYAGISVFSPFSGMTVDAPGARVVLRGLTINGQGGFLGIWMLNGAELHVENCVIAGLTNGLRVEAGHTVVEDTIIRSSDQNGIVVDAGAVSVHLNRVRLHNNGSSGIRLDQINSSLRASIRNSEISDNGAVGILVTSSVNSLNVVDIESTQVTSNGWGGNDFGILVFANDATAKAEVSISNCLVARNHSSGIYATASTGDVHVSVTDSTITGNYGPGLVNSSVTMIASRNTVTRNTPSGMQNSGGLFYTTNDNRVQGNFGMQMSGTFTTLGGL